MTSEPVTGELVAEAMEILRANRYGVLARASPDGAPWVSPVYLAHGEWSAGPPDLWWVSSPDSRHSRLLAVNSHVAVTVCDSNVAIGDASAVYAEGRAEECDRDAAAENIELFSDCCVRDGGGSWDLDRVTGAARLRLHRLRITALYVLAREGPDRTIPVWP